MARPPKKNADYFSHDAGMRNDPKIKALRRKFGLSGYSVWVMVLETLTSSDYFQYQWTELGKELLAGDIDIDRLELEAIIEYCETLNLLQIRDDCLLSEKHIERFELLLKRRSFDRKRKAEELSSGKTPPKEVIPTENPQSKVKESKVNLLTNYDEEDFLEEWSKCRKSYKGLPTNILRMEPNEKVLFNKAKKDFSREHFQKAMKGLFKQEQIKFTSMILRPFHFLERVETYLNAFETNDFKLYGSKPIEQ